MLTNFVIYKTDKFCQKSGFVRAKAVRQILRVLSETVVVLELHHASIEILNLAQTMR